MNMNKSCKVSVRLSPWQEQVLHEMSDALGVGYSMLIRTIVGSWLTTNEEHVYRLLDKKKNEKENGLDKQTGEEEEKLF